MMKTEFKGIDQIMQITAKQRREVQGSHRDKRSNRRQEKVRREKKKKRKEAQSIKRRESVTCCLDILDSHTRHIRDLGRTDIAEGSHEKGLSSGLSFEG